MTEVQNSGSRIWRLDNANSTGQPVQYSLGTSGLLTNFEYDSKRQLSKITTGTREQSFSFDSNTGNLSNRKYKMTTDTATLREYFTYDNMNRLYTSRVGAAVNTVNYSNNGNITSRTGLGSYTYNDTQIECCCVSCKYFWNNSID